MSALATELIPLWLQSQGRPPSRPSRIRCSTRSLDRRTAPLRLQSLAIRESIFQSKNEPEDSDAEVWNLLSCFLAERHTKQSSPGLWECGNPAGISKGCGNGGKAQLFHGFPGPSFPQPVRARFRGKRVPGTGSISGAPSRRERFSAPGFGQQALLFALHPPGEVRV